MSTKTPAFGSVDLYQGRHRCQYDGGMYQYQNCVPTSLADAADAVTGGGIDVTGTEVRNLVKPYEEENPDTPGWTLNDAKKAASRLGINLTVNEAGSWGNLVKRRYEGRAIILQGDSDQFGNDTCSGAFDGGHCIMLPPLDNSDGRWRIGDPICNSWRWESETTIRKYAEKFGSGTAFFAFTDPVPGGHEMGVRVNITEQYTGTATVMGDGHSAVQVADGDVIAVPNGQKRQVFGKGTLAEDWRSPGGTLFAAGTPVVLIGTELAILFTSDVSLDGSAGSIEARDEEWVKWTLSGSPVDPAP